MTMDTFLPRELPAGLEPLTELALDLRWTWNHAGDQLWRAVDPVAWEATQNPWVILQSTPWERLDALAADASFRQGLTKVVEERRRYLSSTATAGGAPAPGARTTAYFSMEFGLSEALPLYAGGLGVLSGDHLKAASDFGVPLVAIGLLYQEGYFRQFLDASGRQQELYPYNEPTALPIQPALGRSARSARSDGWLIVPVELPGRTLHLRVWRATVGGVVLYLLDSNVPLNDAVDRGITGKLYGDGQETRLCQEIVLGIGGWRLLEALEIPVGACHLNEGHTGFAVLGRIRNAMRTEGLSFHAALWATRAGNVFTTHTPVVAGFDAFPPALMAKYFPDGRGILADLGIDFAELLRLGRAHPDGTSEPFLPAYLALHGSAHVNAVSRLHGATSRQLFQPLFPHWPEHEVPVEYVTNGIHVPSWDSRWADQLWTAASGPDRWRQSVEVLQTRAKTIDDPALWAVRGHSRAELIERARQRLADQLGRRGAAPEKVEEAKHILDPDVLTLGFARRFAEYKRPNLLLRDWDRLIRLLTNPHRPAQLLVAGKAHPADGEGKALVESWVRFANQPAVRAHCVFLEDYDFTVAQELVQGVDVWINTPRRPWEACGTSGMKVLVNGGLNLSVLDGWWAEAYAPGLGWAIGTDAAAWGVDVDARDAEALFEILEREVVPLFYDRDQAGLPRQWLARVRASLSQLTPRFSASRMVEEYVTRYYRAAEQEVTRRLADKGALARGLESWANRLTTHWPALRFGHVEAHDHEGRWEISVEVYLDELAPDDVAVELFADSLSAGEAPVRIPMLATGPLAGSTHGYLFSVVAPGGRPAADYTPRIVPASTGAHAIAVPLELPLVTWHH
jgi:starch phosphorylase